MAISRRLRFEILTRDNHTCRYCGAHAPDVVLQIDHVVPVSLGGTDDPTNLVAACADCNGGKSSVSVLAGMVAEVSDDALRWSAAMQKVAEDQWADERALRRNIDLVLEEFGDYGIRTPFNARESITSMIEAGADPEMDLAAMVPVAARSRANDRFRYWCGCVWNRLKQRQAAAQMLLNNERPGDGLTDEEF